MDTVIKKSDSNNKKSHLGIKRLIYSLISIVLGIMVGVVILSILGYNPSTLFVSLWDGNLGSLQNFGNFLSTFTWIAFLGLSMMVSFKAGIFNIGISAEMVGGGLFGYLFASFVNTQSRAGVIFSIMIPILVGISIAMFIAFLKNRFKIHEVVSSIMLNWSVYWIYKYFMNPSNVPNVFNGGSVPKDIYANNSLRMPWLTEMFDGSTINLAIFILLITIPIIWFLYNKTTFGIRQNIIGNNKDVAIYTGINVKSEVYKAMAISGALAGMAGAAFYLGTNQSLTSVSGDLAPEAFNGITVALIGFNGTIGVVFASIFVALFENSKVYLSVYANREIANLIMAVIILFLAITNYFLLYEPHKKIKKWLNYEDVDHNLEKIDIKDDNISKPLKNDVKVNNNNESKDNSKNNKSIKGNNNKKIVKEGDK